LEQAVDYDSPFVLNVTITEKSVPASIVSVSPEGITRVSALNTMPWFSAPHAAPILIKSKNIKIYVFTLPPKYYTGAVKFRERI